MDADRTGSLITDRVAFAESPCWWDGALWFSDVHDFTFKRVGANGQVSVVAQLPGRPSGCGFFPDGRLLMGTALDGALSWIHPDGAVETALDLSDELSGLINDMVVTGNGRAYFGDTGFRPDRGQPPAPGRVFLFEPGRGARVVAEDMEFPNGCAVSPDGTVLYYAESFGARVSRFDVEPNGELSNRVEHADLGEAPDGLCLDSSGCLWVALPHSGRFVRVDPSGSIIDELHAAAPFAVTCLLGGHDRRTLFMSSAYTDLERLSRGESSGRIDAIRVPDAGAGWP